MTLSVRLCSYPPGEGPGTLGRRRRGFRVAAFPCGPISRSCPPMLVLSRWLGAHDKHPYPVFGDRVRSATNSE